MQATLSIFDDRKEEIELYYSIMIEIESNKYDIPSINNSRFVRIIKSNLLLMLYNMVEACIVSGMLEIYESLTNSECTYNQVIEEIQHLWTNFQISQIYGPTTRQVAYENRVNQMIQTIIASNPITLTKESLRISGNLDAKIIKKICDNHRIRYRAKDKIDALQVVKDKRNSLAHGDVSFSDCARDFTLEDLEKVKDATIDFLQGILNGMSDYYTQKGYMVASYSN